MSNAEYEWIKELWPIFFPKLEIHPAEKLLVVINLFFKFFLSSQGRPLISCQGLPQKDSVYIDIPSLHRLMALPDFMEMLVTKPKDVIGCISIAVSLINHYIKLYILDTSSNTAISSNGNSSGSNSNSNSNGTGSGNASTNTTTNIHSNPFEMITSVNPTQQNRNSSTSNNDNDNLDLSSQSSVFTKFPRSNLPVRSNNLRPIYAQLQNLQPSSSFCDLKSGSLGRLVSIVGYVVRISQSHHMIMGATYVCGKCETNFVHYFEDGVFVPPVVCPTPK